MDKMHTKGFYQFMGWYLEQLLSRKLVALFSSYESAKSDIMMEALNRWSDQIEGMKRVIEVLEVETDMLEYFENLGKK